MAITEPSFDRPDWRDERAYDYTAQLTRREWAWEFLRRNAQFQRDLTVALGRAQHLERSSQLDIVNSSVDLTKWGVMFRGLVAS